jgi:hypothetical protein
MSNVFPKLREYIQVKGIEFEWMNKKRNESL